MKRQYILVSVALSLLATGCATSGTDARTNEVSAAQTTAAPTGPASQLHLKAGQAAPVPVLARQAPSDPLHSPPLPAEQQAFSRELAAARGLPHDAIEAALAQARYNDTVARLMVPAKSAGDRPRVRNWPAYRARFVEPVRIRDGLTFWREHRAILDAAEQRYGVPASVIVAIIGVETVYGRNMGNFRVLDALYTLAFAYPPHAPRDRSPFFREELAEYLAMTLSSGIDPTALRGSYAGAIGIPQFMPGSIRRYAVSTGAGAVPDLVNNPHDAIMSVANYLAGHGWQAGHPIFPPARLPPEPARLVDHGLEPRLTWEQLASAGARYQDTTDSRRPGLIATAHAAPVPAWLNAPIGVINLENTPAGTTEYRIAGKNFFVITQYNRSYFYAASVADLAQELERRMLP